MTYVAILFWNCISNFNDYSMPILPTSDFTNYLNVSKHIFLQQWAFLSLHCNINSDCDGEHLMDFKERQVFIALLMLQQMSNLWSLPHWCLILSTTMYGWGTRDTLGHATSFMGIMVLRSYRDCFYSSLTCKICRNSDPVTFQRDLWINGVRQFPMRQSVERAMWWKVEQIFNQDN